MFQFFKRLFKSRSTPQRAPEKPRLLRGGSQPSRSSTTTPSRLSGKSAPAPAQPKAREEWAKRAALGINLDATPEEICGLTPEMTQEEVAERLAFLYRRHNRASSSLEAHLREEAEIMLEVVAEMRLKYLP